jgi:hypothetical protein
LDGSYLQKALTLLDQAVDYYGDQSEQAKRARQAYEEAAARTEGLRNAVEQQKRFEQERDAFVHNFKAQNPVMLAQTRSAGVISAAGVGRAGFGISFADVFTDMDKKLELVVTATQATASNTGNFEAELQLR